MQNLIAQLAQQFGLRPEQIQAGAGAILQLLQQHAGGTDFQQLLAKIPGAQTWLAQAQAAPQEAGAAGGGLLGQAASIFGALSGQEQTGGIAGVIGKLGQAGFKPDTAMQFVPALLEQLKGAAGADTLNKVLANVPGLNNAGGAGGGAGALLGKLLG